MFTPTLQQRTKLIKVLVKARKKAKLNQTQLSEKIGAAATFANKVENFKRDVSFFEVVAWAEATDEDPVELIRRVVE